MNEETVRNAIYKLNQDISEGRVVQFGYCTLISAGIEPLQGCFIHTYRPSEFRGIVTENYVIRAELMLELAEVKDEIIA